MSSNIFQSNMFDSVPMSNWAKKNYDICANVSCNNRPTFLKPATQNGKLFHIPTCEIHEKCEIVIVKESSMRSII